MNNKTPFTNRLINSSSPYLLQHAHNPVDWYEWGEEAFQKARDEDKPIFLSIGYSTCHWCHVMAHESFEDADVARLLNENYVCIKVDREERPDIDQFYMAAATRLIGRGGWPLTIVMGHDKRPFFAGTYFPRESKPGRVGMLDLLPRITKAWETQRDEVTAAADQIIDALQQPKGTRKREALTGEILQAAVTDFKRNYDSKEGGFGSAPKFPSPHNLVFLLREGYRTGDSSITDMALHTLKAMRLGGIYDQVGFGFHRYSTDAQWLVPHFEKMLYDQATLLLAYTEAWQISQDPLFLQTMEEIYHYLMDELISPRGGFYSAEDADSEGEEGKFYVWSWEELSEILAADELTYISEHFGIKPEGNFDDEASRKPSGRNIFHTEAGDKSQSILKDQNWHSIRLKLKGVREKRIHPSLDNKILSDWNGLMLTALSRAAQATGDPRYREASVNLAKFIKDEMITSNGQLLHMSGSSGNSVGGFLDDYSFVIQGLRAVYEVTYEPEYLSLAIQLQQIQIDKFWDREAGGFFFTAEGESELIIRQKEIYDGAIPSGNSIAAENLYYLGRLSENPAWEVLSHRIGESFSVEVTRGPRGAGALLQTVQVQVAGSREIVIAGGAAGLSSATELIRRFYNPFKLILYRPNTEPEGIEEIAGFLAYQKAIEGGFTVYICENYACQQPQTNLEGLETALQVNQNR